ncbi:trypsin-like serine peptidase, partial [Streptosporangium sandarakinum]
VKGLPAALAAGDDRPAAPAHGRPAAATERLAAPAAGNRRAVPVTGARWVTGGSVAQTTGRVFLTVGGVDYVCSAGSVRSANRDLVVTAGHCVKDGAGAWADNWVFVPGYDRGRQPYGQFTARRMFVAGPWARGADDSYDVGMVALNTRNGRHLGDVVGAQEIAFGTPRGRPAHGFGFPADAPYDGEQLVYCAGPVHDDPHEQTADQGMRCDMTAGSSGGPWLTGFDAVTGRGTITSVSSFKYSDDHGTMYGPYFGSTIRDLHTVAERS